MPKGETPLLCLETCLPDCFYSFFPIEMDEEQEDPDVAEFMRSLEELNGSSYNPAHQATRSVDEHTTRIVRPAVRCTVSLPVAEDGCTVEAPRVQVNLSRIAFFEMQRWYPAIEPFTFRSVLLPMEATPAEIDGAIAMLNGEAFFKLSSVSAKDVCIVVPGERPNYSRLCVKSAKDVASLIASSERLQHSLAQRRGETIVLRRWIPDLDSRFEFRCFVFENHVTAVSQYEYVNAYPIWSDDQFCKTMFAEILAFLDSVLPRLSPLVCTEWTIDVVKHGGKWSVVEINAFGADLNVGGCLFHWDIDYNILLNPDKLPVMRVLSQSGIENRSEVFIVKQIHES